VYFTKYYAALGRVVAFRKNGALFWVGTDHLGGTIRVTDASFNPLDQMRYLPYGGSRDSGTNLGTDHLFTSQVQDGSVGLYWYGSRAYDPALGRFACPDPIVPSVGDPQSLNRYSYVHNNPTSRVDPTGYYDLTTVEGRVKWRTDHSGWWLGEDSNGNLAAEDPARHAYDLGIHIMHGGPSGVTTGGVFLDSRISAHGGEDNTEWDYLFPTKGKPVLIRNNVDDTGWHGDEVPFEPATPGAFLDSIGAPAVTLADDEVWTTGEIMTRSV
jgi:RHS repeat-associated protein